MTNSLALFYINRNKTNDITTLQQTRRLSAYVKQTQIGAPNNLPATWALEWINTRLLTTDTNRSCRYRNPRLGTARRCQSRRQSAQISKSRLKTQKIDDIFCLTMGSNHCLFAHPRMRSDMRKIRPRFATVMNRNANFMWYELFCFNKLPERLKSLDYLVTALQLRIKDRGQIIHSRYHVDTLRFIIQHLRHRPDTALTLLIDGQT